MQKRSRLALIAGLTLVLALESSAAALSSDIFIAATVWRSTDAMLGGLSGLELSDDGRSFIAISDRGGWTKGQITRDAAGRINGLVASAVAPLKDIDGQPLKWQRGDSEGLAIAPNGDIFISFEGKGSARVMRFADLSAPGKDLPRAAAFPRLRPNAALEALAIDAQGILCQKARVTQALTLSFAIKVAHGIASLPCPATRHLKLSAQILARTGGSICWNAPFTAFSALPAACAALP